MSTQRRNLQSLDELLASLITPSPPAEHDEAAQSASTPPPTPAPTAAPPKHRVDPNTGLKIHSLLTDIIGAAGPDDNHDEDSQYSEAIPREDFNYDDEDEQAEADEEAQVRAYLVTCARTGCLFRTHHAPPRLRRTGAAVVTDRIEHHIVDRGRCCGVWFCGGGTQGNVYGESYGGYGEVEAEDTGDSYDAMMANTMSIQSVHSNRKAQKAAAARQEKKEEEAEAHPLSNMLVQLANTAINSASGGIPVVQVRDQPTLDMRLPLLG